jgi:hypothetical protein
MRRFHHVGVITDEPQRDEVYVAETRVHVTNPSGRPSPARGRRTAVLGGGGAHGLVPLSGKI